MMYCRFAATNEAELAGDTFGWTTLMRAVASGVRSFPLHLEMDPYPFDRMADIFRIEMAVRLDDGLPVGRFYVDGNALVFSGASDDVEWLVEQIEALLNAPQGTHFHIDAISFSERLVESTLELVFRLSYG